MNPIIPNNNDITIAKESSRALASLLSNKATSRDLQLSDLQGTNKIAIPNAASNILLDILTQMSMGNAVTVIPLHAELTTQEAADILKVSRPFIIKLLKDGQIPYKMVGTRRKILFLDLMVYKDTMYRARLGTLI
jgi:excisionase family DNA binding protein